MKITFTLRSILLFLVLGLFTEGAPIFAQGGGSVNITVLNTTNASCLGLSNGSVTVSASGGTAPYNYSWSPTGGTDSVAVNLAPGTYTVFVTDAAQNTGSVTVDIAQNDPLLISLLNQSDYSGFNISCAGASDASLLTSASGGFINSPDSVVFPYTGSVQTFTVPAGVSQVFMKVWGAQGGANWVNNTNFGGYAEGIMNVNPGDILEVYVGGQPAGTAGGWNGGGAGDGGGAGGGGASDIRYGGSSYNERVIVGAGGGGAGYWSNLHVIGGIGGGLTGGDGYRNTTADMGGLGATQSGPGANGTCVSFNVTALAGGFGYGGTPLGQNCGCEGYGGGAGWYGGAGSGNCRGGGGGSSYVGSLINGFTTGGVRAGHGRVVISYQVPGNFMYSWSSGQSDSAVSGIAAGSYVLTVTSPIGCTASQTFTVTQPAALSATAAASPEVSGNDGAVTLSVNGGVSPYVFLWSNNATTQNISGLSSGTYSVQVTDANLCTTSVSVTVASHVGLENTTGPEFRIYPNPVSDGVLYVDASMLPESGGTLRITDVSGRVLYNRNIVPGNAASFPVMLQNWSPGTYFISLQTTGTPLVKAFVIR